MKKKYFTFLFLILNNILFAAADLVVASSSVSPTFVDNGDIFAVQGTIKNIGNATAKANYMFIYLSSDLDFQENEIIGRISVKQLTAGQAQTFIGAYSIPTSNVTQKGNYYIGYQIDPFDDVVENNENNYYYNTTKISVSGIYKEDMRIPCPIIFVHGWIGNSRTWYDYSNKIDTIQGWAYGGRLDYCLNPDGNKKNADEYILSFDNDKLLKADYYLLNFDVATNGKTFVSDDGIAFNDDYSNQSAITKQGWAVSNAVKKVLEKTGAEKVILIGHSMGGLAIREYIQNTKNYQTDGKHHIAKLITVGTPNQGSNTSGSTLVNLFGSAFGPDTYSEAVRDLRYKSALFSGLFLDGGTESSLTFYNNDDVNCNGFVGDNITGLNQRTTPSNLDYSCVVSDYSLDPTGSGDGVVDLERADINNIIAPQPPLKAQIYDKYKTTSFHNNIHKERKNFGIITRSLDEPYLYDLAYPIPLNTLWFGIVSEQADNNPLPAPDNKIDYDDFKIDITQAGDLTVSVYNIPVNTFTAYLVDASYKVVKEVASNGESFVSFAASNLKKGTYYIEFGAVPTPNSWAFHYSFETIFRPTSKLQASFTTNKVEGCKPLSVNFTSNSQGNPTSYEWTFAGGTPSTSISSSPTVVYKETGIYPVTLKVKTSTDEHIVTKNALIKVNSAPETDFSYALLSQDTVKFINKTNTFGLATTYNWSFGDNTNSNEFAPIHKYPKSGTYTAKLTAQNSCGAIQKSQQFTTKFTSVNELSYNGIIKILPNPNNGIFNIEIENDYIGIYKIFIINELGSIVFEKEFLKNSEIYNELLDLNIFPSGIYALILKDTVSSFSNKIIIQK